MGYPRAERLDLVEVLHGHPVADPYRWLEDAGDPRTQRWSHDQDALVRCVLDAGAGREALRARLSALLPGVIGLPTVAGGRTFFRRRQPGQEHAVLVVADDGGGERVLVDPAAVDPSLTTTLDLVAISKEGDRVAYVTSEGGREEGVMHVVDATTGAMIDGPVLLGRGPDVAWLAGGEELVYVARLPDERLPAGEEQFHRRVWRHRLGTPRSRDELLFGEGVDSTAYFGVETSEDGRWLSVSVALGTAPRNDLYLWDLGGEGGFRSVQQGVDAQTWGSVGRDGRLYLFTNRDAPRWRLCVCPPETPDYEHWRDLLAEGEEVLTGYTVTDDAVVAVREHHVVSRVSIHDRDAGAWRADLSLPGPGTAVVTSRPAGGDDVWIGYTDHVRPFRVLHHRVGSTDLEPTLWAEAPGSVSIDGIDVRQVFAPSADGTAVPMFIIEGDHRVEGQHTVEGQQGLPGPRPTVLYGYGGFNVALRPDYSASIVAWVERGGVYAVANLRGGSEYGEAWHRAGMRENKQNVFDDFLAAAEWLNNGGYSSPERLGISGGSNGGLLVGAAITQRPELFRAAACSAPLLDMVRYERFGLGRTWNDEYGRADDPDELRWLLSYSPYHHVVPGTRYPAILFTVFEGDTRVDPLHARKLCAALQHATSAGPDERPVLIRREQGVGHSSRAVSRMIELQVDVLSFLASQLGLALDGRSPD